MLFVFPTWIHSCCKINLKTRGEKRNSRYFLKEMCLLIYVEWLLACCKMVFFMPVLVMVLHWCIYLKFSPIFERKQSTQH